MNISSLLNKIPLEYRILGSVFIVVISPFLFTRSWSSTFYFDDDTAGIGDTIGGLTAPAIGLINAWLLYVTLKRQDHLNKVQGEQIEEQRRYFEHDRNIDTIKWLIASIRFTAGLKSNLERGRDTYAGSEALYALSAFFKVPIIKTYEDIDLKEIEIALLTIRLSEINIEALSALQLNNISKRNDDQKQYIIESIERVLWPMTELYLEVGKFNEAYPIHPFRKELNIDQLMKLRTNLYKLLKPSEL